MFLGIVSQSDLTLKRESVEVVARGRIELPTRRFSVCCSTD